MKKTKLVKNLGEKSFHKAGLVENTVDTGSLAMAPLAKEPLTRAPQQTRLKEPPKWPWEATSESDVSTAEAIMPALASGHTDQFNDADGGSDQAEASSDEEAQALRKDRAALSADDLTRLPESLPGALPVVREFTSLGLVVTAGVAGVALLQSGGQSATVQPAIISGNTTGALTENDSAQSISGTLSIQGANGVATFREQASIAGSHGYGHFTMSSAGQWTYTMDNAHQEFAAGQTYTDSFTAMAADGTTQVVTVTMTGINHAPTGGVTITGTARAGHLLTASTTESDNTLADPDTLGTLRYTWFADGEEIAGATNRTYLLSSTDVGKAITVAVRYTDGWGASEQVTSLPTPATLPVMALHLATDTGNASDGITSDAIVQVNGLAANQAWEYSLDSGLHWQTGTGSRFSLTDTAQPAWTVYQDGADLRLRSYISGQSAFDFRIGGAGAISDILDLSNSNTRLIMPHGGTETTDRVLQWTLWDLQLSGAIPGQTGAGLRFNVNQVGNSANDFNSTSHIEVHPDGVIDVWYKPDLQWNTGLQNQFGEHMSALTRYELAADGVIKVKHMIMVSDVTLNGQPATMAHASLGIWQPFLHDAVNGFTSVATQLDAAGTPLAGYTPSEMSTRLAQNLRYTNSNGYLVAYNANQSGSMPAIGVVFGKENSNDGTASAFMVDFGSGLGINPNFDPNQPLQSGAVLEMNYCLVVRPSLDEKMSELVQQYAQTPMTNTVWQPGEASDSATSALIDQLSAVMAQSVGTRTDHVNDLVQANGTGATDPTVAGATDIFAATQTPGVNSGNYAAGQVLVRSQGDSASNTQAWQIDLAAPVVGLSDWSLDQGWAPGSLTFTPASLGISDTTPVTLTQVSLKTIGTDPLQLTADDLTLTHHDGAWIINLKPSGLNKTGHAIYTVTAVDATGQSTTHDVAVHARFVNDRPSVDEAIVYFNTPEDATPTGQTISSLIGEHFQDPDAGSSMSGIAIQWNQTPVQQGTWQYSLNAGLAWHDLPSDLATNNVSQSLYLRSQDWIRFVPAANYNGTSTQIFYRVTDDTFPATMGGTRVDLMAYSNGSTSFSPISAPGGVSVLYAQVSAVNDAAVIGGTSTGSITESNAAQSTTGTLTITDIDSAATFAAQTNTVGDHGYGKFSLTTSGAWTYTMDSAHNEFAAGQTYTDRFIAVAADGTTQTVTVTMTGTNDQPIMGSSVSTTTAEDTALRMQVSSLLVSPYMSDPDAGNAFKGIAISWNKAPTSVGTWAWSTNGSTGWTALPSDMTGADASFNKVSNAVYLNASDYLRFTPAANYTGSVDQLLFRAADGTMADTVSGTRLNVSNYTGSAQAMTLSPNGITVSVTAVNDAAVIGGTTTGAITETNSIQSVNGTLTISDIDSPATFVAQAQTAGSNGYGKFNLASNGAWTYTMDSAHDEFVAAQTYTDSFTAVAADGTSQTVTVTLTGAVEQTLAISLADSGDSASAATGSDGRTAERTVQVSGLEVDDQWEYSTDGGSHWSTGTGDSFALPDTAKPVWSLYQDGSDLKIRSYIHGVEQFDLRLGSSGALSDITDLTNQNLRLVSDALGGNTDRVLQWTLWDHALTNPASSVADKRFNVTQAGDGTGAYQPTITVDLSRAGVIDIWSTPDKQWQVPGFTQDMAALTRYEFLADGVVKVRHLVQVGEVTLNGTAANLTNTYFENWLPFLKNGNGGFTAMALGLDANGGVTQNYSALASTYPQYPSWEYSTTHGYAVVYNENTPGSAPAMGVVFGKTSSTDGRAALNTMRWDTGIGVLPSLQLNQTVQTGAVIDSSYFLVMRTGLSAELKSVVDQYAALATAPVIWQPNETADSTTSALIGKLTSYRTGTPTTVNTDQLADLVQVTGTTSGVAWPALSENGVVSPPADTFANLAATDTHFGIYDAGQIVVRRTHTATTATASNTQIWTVDDAAPVLGLTQISLNEDWANGSFVLNAAALSVQDASNTRLSSVSLQSVTGTGAQALTASDIELTQNGDDWSINLESSGAHRSGTLLLNVTAMDAVGLSTSQQVTVIVKPVNDRPYVDVATLEFSATEDATPTGQSISSLIGTHFKDADANSSLQGMAIQWNNVASSQGVWQYSLDAGSTWSNMPSDLASNSLNTALYLSASNWLRFVPASNFSGASSSMLYRVVDDSFPATTPGSRINLLNWNNGNSASDPISVGGAATSLIAQVGAVNDAAVIGGVSTGAITESNAAQTATGTLTITDIDSATTFAAQTNTVGDHAYGKFSLTTSGAWTYTMDNAHNEFAAGQPYTDSFTAVSADGTTHTVTVTMTGSNDQPTTGTNITQQTVRNTAVSTQISSLVVKGTHWTDLDENATLKGLAISWSQATAAQGTWDWSADGATGWTALPDLSTNQPSTAVFLNATDYLRFTPTTGYTGTAGQLYFRVADNTFSDTASGTQVNVSQFNSTGQAMTLAPLTVSVSVAVAPVVIDLDRDGALTYGQVTMDVNGDGHLDRTAWAGSGDGVLVWDKYADGLVHDQSQYAFSQYAQASAADGQSATDLSGLADAFDSNQDGVFSALDAKFHAFKVWQDANQNGISEAQEVRSLSEWRITEITLSSDDVARTPAPGVTEAGRTTAMTSDGTPLLVADAAFEFHTLESIDLSSFSALHADLSEVDMPCTATDSLKIHLNDVLPVAHAGALQIQDHTLLHTRDLAPSYLSFAGLSAHLSVEETLHIIQ